MYAGSIIFTAFGSAPPIEPLFTFDLHFSLSLKIQWERQSSTQAAPLRLPGKHLLVFGHHPQWSLLLQIPQSVIAAHILKCGD